MTALSKEQDNYVRLCLLLTGTAPRAVRCVFDREFHPSCLDTSLKTEYITLKQLLKNRILSVLQWDILFPRFPDVPKSENFDVTLMITILRGLKKIPLPGTGYNKLPPSHETTVSSDLARINHYRNDIAHMKTNEIKTCFFNTAWKNITEAISRLGGHLMKEECDDLRSKILDQSNVQIMYEIRISHSEIENVKNELGIVQIQMQDMKHSQRNWQFHIPMHVKTQFASATSVKVEWEPPEKTNIHFQGYKIFWKEKGTVTDDPEYKEVPKDETSVIVDGLMELTDYSLWVSAVSKKEEETLHHSQLINFKTRTGVPTRPPQKLTCIPNQNGTSIDVSWEAPPEEHNSNISGYNVYSQKTSDGIEEEAEFKTSTGLRTVLTGLLPSTKYLIWISALSVNGSGPSSEQSIVSTNACPTNSPTFSMFHKCDLRKAKLKVKMPAALAQNMALNQGNISSKKHEVNQLLLDNSNANLPIEPLRKKRPIEPLRKNRNRKCKKIKE